MATRGCNADDALAELVRLSQHTNTKLRDVADMIVREAGLSE